jgi:general secretion pathway protein K
VLWILIALAALASVFSIYLANSAVAVAVKDNAVEGELLVSSALEFVAYQLLIPDQNQNRPQNQKQNQNQSQNQNQNPNQNQNQNQRPKQGPTHGAFRFRVGQATVSANFTAETARIDLNAAPKAMLAGLFAALGVQGPNAEQFADRIIGWRTTPKPQDTENEDARYRSAGLTYGPRGAPFVHMDELWLVEGLPPGLVERIMPFVTIYSGRPEINVLDAPPQVIAALPGMTPARLNAFLDQREGGSADADSISRLLGDQAGTTTEGSDAIRVQVRIAFDNGRRAASEAVILLGAADEPYHILSWRDDIDAADAGQRATQGPR